MTRMAVWNLRKGWDPGCTTADKLERFAQALMRLADPEQILDHLETGKHESVPIRPLVATADSHERTRDAVAF